MSTKGMMAAALLLAAAPAAVCLGQSAEGRIRLDISRLHEEMAAQEENIRRSGEEEISVLDELDKINMVLEEQQGKMQALEKQLHVEQQVLAKTADTLTKTKAARDRALQHMLNRLRSFYMMGRLGILNVTFSNKALPELLLCMDAFKQVIGYDRTVIDSYRVSVAELEKATLSQELEASLLEELVRQADEERQALHNTRAEREKLLDRIRTQQDLHQLAIKEMRTAEEQLKQTLVRLKQKKDGTLNGKAFAQAKGTLPMPAAGKVVRRFGEVLQDGLRKGEAMNGISIAVPPETPVQAVFAGKAVLAGYQRGYGNAVIIDHGSGWFTVTSRLDSILVQEGDRIRQNQQIGTSGDIATLYEPGLYFEIRQGSEPQDPLQWLRQ